MGWLVLVVGCIVCIPYPRSLGSSIRVRRFSLARLLRPGASTSTTPAVPAAAARMHVAPVRPDYDVLFVSAAPLLMEDDDGRGNKIRKAIPHLVRHAVS